MQDYIATHVGVVIKHDGSTIWVNVEGCCMLRISGITHLEIDDERIRVPVRFSPKNQGGPQ